MGSWLKVSPDSLENSDIEPVILELQSEWIIHYTTVVPLQYGSKVKKRAKIRNRYIQAPHLTQDTNGKVTTSQLDITNKSQEITPSLCVENKHNVLGHSNNTF